MSDWRHAHQSPFPLPGCMRTSSTEMIQYHTITKNSIFIICLDKREKSSELAKAFNTQSYYLLLNFIHTTLQNRITDSHSQTWFFSGADRLSPKWWWHGPHGLKSLEFCQTLKKEGLELCTCYLDAATNHHTYAWSLLWFSPFTIPVSMCSADFLLTYNI